MFLHSPGVPEVPMDSPLARPQYRAEQVHYGRNMDGHQACALTDT